MSELLVRALKYAEDKVANGIEEAHYREVIKKLKDSLEKRKKKA